MLAVRQAIQRQIHDFVGFGTGVVDLDLPKGDPGLFGPGTMAWRVHADFTSMMIGGVAALLLQMLHPRALAGVWDHSDFRRDMPGRLRRTAQFVSGTTYGATGQALQLIERVRSIHDRVHGTLPDGSSYSANDPDLLTWVHVAEVSSFMRAHMRYHQPHLSKAEQDEYFAQTATIAERLGATCVPRSRPGIQAYLHSIRPELRHDSRTREVARALLDQPAPRLAAKPFGQVVLKAGIDLLPDWAAEMHGFRLGIDRHAARAGARSFGAVLRWALRDGSAIRARRRVDA
ncbi:oxygenase MpaB family protein [Sphingosinicella rhizophila]|uniref:Oxygenase MpaB family protein n=1 Tax=Sphingosinicella rhizophila TaxID=3050082 RepID=A0ABU3Q7E0_9SPHN|nr:oxygenase MpaB family protein [Sphingosinicella sp. GR2756]MDT9599316.1 oxygenase MpaB family protein [Sphingosinicella sp. GR2756]